MHTHTHTHAHAHAHTHTHMHTHTYIHTRTHTRTRTRTHTHIHTCIHTHTHTHTHTNTHAHAHAHAHNWSSLAEALWFTPQSTEASLSYRQKRHRANQPSYKGSALGTGKKNTEPTILSKKWPVLVIHISVIVITAGLARTFVGLASTIII